MASSQDAIPEKIKYILDLARWAPSGDNEQPWCFEVVDDMHFVVHGHDTSDWCVYDLGGSASQIALGALLENIRIAASGVGCRAVCSRRGGLPDETPVFDVRIQEDSTVEVSGLLANIERRVTQRRPLKTTPLTQEQKKALECSLGDDYEVCWIEGASNRWQMAKLLYRSAYIRLTIPEAYETHTRNIEWGAQFSEDRIPDKAVGADWMTLRIMQWGLKSWGRVNFLNKLLVGTIFPRLQLDLLPGFLCGSHFLLSARKPLKSVDDYIDGGSAMQRFWLTATQCGLNFQPEMTPLIFSRYDAQNRPFTESAAARQVAQRVRRRLAEISGVSDFDERSVFMGRLGAGQIPSSRSRRKPLKDLTR